MKDRKRSRKPSPPSASKQHAAPTPAHGPSTGRDSAGDPRAAEVLRLQRQAGNRAAAAAVQRQPPNREFIPELSVKPASQTGQVGGPFRQVLTVLNWRDAPRGTSFHWGGGPLDEGIEFLRMPETTRDGRSWMELMPRRPGTSSVRANLQHQVPGGPRKVWQGPDIPVTTPKPRLKVEFVSAPVHDNVMDFARLSPGDRHIITVEAVGVGKRIGELGPMWGTSATSGVVSLTPTRSLGPTKQEYAVVGNKAGPFDYTISWQIPNTDMLPVESGGVHGSVMMDRQEFINRCTTAHQIVDGKYDLIGAFTKELSIMYGHAWKMHTGALKGANARRRLIGELIMFGALAFVTGGVGGAVGKYVSSRFAKDSYGGVIAGDAFKDLWKDTSRRLGAAGIQGQAGPPALEAFPEDPTVWQNKEEAAILREAGQMKLLISDWSDGASKSRQFPTDFDPVDTINDKLRVAGVKPEQLGSPKEDEALRFEKGFWKEWLGKYAYELKLPMGCSPLLRLESNLDKPIEERIEACAKGLGEDGEAWIDAWASPLKRELERRRGY